MQVILLATNDTPKLRPLTDNIPGPLVPIVDRPVMAVAVEILARAGFKHLLVSLRHDSARIVSFMGDGARWGLKIDYITQPKELGLVGTLRWAAPLLRETFLILPADVVLDLDVEAAIAFHHSHGGAATAILHQVREGSTPRPVAVGSDERALAASMSPGGLVAGATGAYIMEPQAIDLLSTDAVCDDDCYLISTLIEAGARVYGYRTSGYWNPLKTFADYQEAQRVFLYSAYRTAAPDVADLPRVRYVAFNGRQIMPGVWAEHGHAIHQSARLTPPIYIGEASRIGREVELGPETVIGANVIIDAEATIQRSTVLKGTYLGQLVDCESRVIVRTTIIDARTEASTQIVDPFLLADLRPMLRTNWLGWLANRLGALALLIAVLPVLLAIGLIVWLTAGRPFRRLPRVGRRPRAPWAAARTRPETVTMLTFETRGSDGASTVFGRWLMRRQLHYLPALWNVLVGDLNLVGVKPLRPEQAARIGEGWQATRYNYPAGLTGPWYMSAGSNSRVEAELIADVYYAAMHTRREAIGILVNTPGAWLRKVKSAGMDSQPADQSSDTVVEQHMVHETGVRSTA
jgi:NDP-sugar pyrophosphorylase family protein